MKKLFFINYLLLLVVVFQAAWIIKLNRRLENFRLIVSSIPLDRRDFWGRK